MFILENLSGKQNVCIFIFFVLDFPNCDKHTPILWGHLYGAFRVENLFQSVYTLIIAFTCWDIILCLSCSGDIHKKPQRSSAIILVINLCKCYLLFSLPRTIDDYQYVMDNYSSRHPHAHIMLIRITKI